MAGCQHKSNWFPRCLGRRRKQTRSSTSITRRSSPKRSPVPAIGVIAIGQFACGLVTLSQFGVRIVSVSQITIAAFPLAQIAIAYSLIAQVGFYVHEGHGQFVGSFGELLESLALFCASEQKCYPLRLSIIVPDTRTYYGVPNVDCVLDTRFVTHRNAALPDAS